ncbi:MAG TPA: ATP synthase F1 subunit gamma, partial [Geminicoccaceae bacterium]|nr:ATP synthase F1 subunit gamma [Geminicoccaceae bacterium]
MPSLKELRNRIGSVKQTQKITSAMKLVAASKLRRAQEQAEASRPFAERMSEMLANLGASVAGVEGAPPLLAGTGRDQVHLIVVATADRGLCGGFNASIARGARLRIRELRERAKEVKVLCVGRKGRDMLRREFGALIVDTIEGVGRRRLEYAEAVGIAERIERMYEAGEFDVCTIVFNRFRSAIAQILTFQQLIPVEPAAVDRDTAEVVAVYEFEPDEQSILAELL